MDKNTSNLGAEAKQRLVDFVGKIDKRLAEFWQGEIEKNFGFSAEQKRLTKEILLHASEHNLRTSKRLRSALVYYGWKLGVSDLDNTIIEEEKIWKACEAVELIHTALLMHDDFMDMDKVRRGKPTTQEFFANGDLHYGNSMAVCTGDVVLCLGFERFLELKSEGTEVSMALRQLMRGIANTALGQALDGYLQKNKIASEEDIIALQISKTGIYTYENPLLSGAILSKLDEEAVDILRRYSREAGIAFQMQDDILGVFGDEERTGKSSDSDIRQGKITMMYLKTIEKLSSEDKEVFLSLWGNNKINRSEIEWIKTKIIEVGAKEMSVFLARDYANRAVEIITELRGNKKVNQLAVDFLEGIARYIVERGV